MAAKKQQSSEAGGEIFVVSDGTGETGAAACRAVMLQFSTPWRLRIFGGVRHPSEVRRVMAQAAEANACRRADRPSRKPLRL